MHRAIPSACLCVLSIIIIGCSKEPVREQSAEAIEFQKRLQTQLIQAKPGDIIVIPAGVHEINRGLSLNVSAVTLRGEGMDKSILSFKNQIQGAEGTPVASVPAGSGVVINSNDRVEIFNNDVADNGDAQVLNADLGNGSDNIVVGAAQHNCRHEKLAAIELAPPL